MFNNIIDFITFCFVFCIILFLYLHIQFHLKTSDELEIYEIEQASKDKMEEICDLRQPVLFDCDEDGDKIIATTNKTVLLETYPVFEVKIRDNKEVKSAEDICVPLPLHMAVKLFNEDKKSTYFSENNSDFLNETGAIKNMSYNDDFLRPHLVANRYYDIMMGSEDTETPFRYDLNYRNYYIVTQGTMKVKLAPPKSSKYLYPINDYENFEFKSPINPWSPQSKFRADFDKIKLLEITLKSGRFLFIPAYWWYSFKFENDCSVSCFKYRTYMNNIAISPNIVMYALQNQNVERKFTRSISSIDGQTPISDDNDDVTINKTNNKNTTDINDINTTSINDITIINGVADSDIQTTQNEYSHIPEILIPKETDFYLQDHSSLLTNNNQTI